MSEQNMQICRFCNRHIKLAYYCEDCGVSCCSDCLHEEKIDYFVCQDCNSKNIEIKDSGKYGSCKDCGSEHINKGSQLLKACPKCHSTSIINIYEKKEELEKSFLDLIKNVRYFIEPLNELINNLYHLREKTKDARAPPIKCYHFPHLEADLLALFKLLSYAKENLHEKISILFNHLSLNKEYFFDIYSQPNENVIIIEGILENLTRSNDSIQEYITNNIKTISTSLESIQDYLKFIEKIIFYFETYKKYLNLAENEKPIYAIYSKLANGLNTQDKIKKSRGILFITNLDLSFVHEYGRLKRKKEVIFKAPVKDLIKIKSQGKMFKKLYIEFPYGRYEFTLPPNNITRVLDYIILARNFDDTIKYDQETAERLNNIYIDLNDITAYIEETINSFFSLKCQYNSINQNPDNLIPINMAGQPNYIPQYIPRIQQQQYQPQSYQPYLNHPNYIPNMPPQNYQVSQPIPPRDYQNLPQQINNNIFPNQDPQNMFIYGNPRVNSQYKQPYYDNRFIPQNLYDPNRIQNYERNRFTTKYNNQRIDPKIHMRKLEKAQRNGLLHSPEVNNSYDIPQSSYSNINEGKHSMYNDYSKIHLSEYFNQENFIPNDLNTNRKYSKKEKEKLRKLRDSEKEKYSLDETLKALDTKFDQGIISEVDYFRTFKNLQKQIYSIDKNIEDLGQELEEIEDIKGKSREFDGRRYYS
ncbi:MAG: B-box zinc finger protein [Promethearchaeota archaeon]